MKPISEVFHGDCMEFMAGCKDGQFDLVVVDPPYGIGVDGQKESTSTHGGRKAYEFKGWDNEPPTPEYFRELFRVSKNQIIWGANYFTANLPASMGWIFWDKGQRICNSDGELAFTSFDQALRVVNINRAFIGQQGGAIHPTQKPIKLYLWLLRNYAKPGDKILDTHLGSQSSRIAAYKLGFDFWGCEIDDDYIREGNARFEKEIAMPLFDAPKPALQSHLNFDAL